MRSPSYSLKSSMWIYPARGNANKRKALLEFLLCYSSLSILWNTNHVAYSNRQKKSYSYNELLNKCKQVEPNTTMDTVVRILKSMLSALRKELKLRDSKGSGASGECIRNIAVVFQRTSVPCRPGHSWSKQIYPGRGKRSYDNVENTVS
jgi:hypothetical protein